jgi:hypothetical protein
MLPIKSHIKSISTILILLTLPIASVYAKDLNKKLKGTYAQNTSWTCLDLGQDGNPNVSSSFTTAGKITYNGDGTANGYGVVGLVIDNGAYADQADYTCEWDVTVYGDGTFLREGTCEVQSRFQPDPPIVTVTNQKWYGSIGHAKQTILLERHDQEIEGGHVVDPEIDGFQRICGKVGTEINMKKKKKRHY